MEPAAAEMSSSSRDWSQLSADLLHEIASHLQDLPDLLRFRFVCCSWRSLTSDLKHLRPNLPWLLLPSFYHSTTSTTFIRRFLSVSEDRIYAIPLPHHTHNNSTSIFPSSSGLLVLVETKIMPSYRVHSISLLNPITLTSTPLPYLVLNRDTDNAIAITITITAAKLFASGIVAILSFTDRCVYFCRIGAAEWTKLPVYCSCSSYFAHHGGRFFFIGRSTPTTEVFDTVTGEIVSSFPLPPVMPFPLPPVIHYTYLVESPSAELLLVQFSQGFSMNLFAVFQLDESDPRELKWVQVKSIGDNVLFLDKVSTMCFNAADFKGCTRNCIYFLNHQGFSKDCFDNLEECGVWLFDIETSQTEQLLSFTHDSPTELGLLKWFVPRLLP